MAVLLSVTDDDELERLVLAHSPKFQKLLNESRRQMEETGGSPHDEFWQQVAAESQAQLAKEPHEKSRKKRKERGS